jgi:hypothetical protein
MILMIFRFVDYGRGLGQKIGFCCTKIMTGVFWSMQLMKICKISVSTATSKAYSKSHITLLGRHLCPVNWPIFVLRVWKTWSEDRFLLYKDNDWGILIYAANENLENLRQCSDMYCDGTFHTCPKPYEQYFTIHGKYRSRVLLQRLWLKWK